MKKILSSIVCICMVLLNVFPAFAYVSAIEVKTGLSDKIMVETIGGNCMGYLDASITNDEAAIKLGTIEYYIGNHLNEASANTCMGQYFVEVRDPNGNLMETVQQGSVPPGSYAAGTGHTSKLDNLNNIVVRLKVVNPQTQQTLMAQDTYIFKNTVTCDQDFQDTTGAGNTNESCVAWLTRTAQAGTQRQVVNDAYPNILMNQCTYIAADNSCQTVNDTFQAITWHPVSSCGGERTQSYRNIYYPVDGAWSVWSACPNGTQARTCTNPAPACGGAACSGPASQSCSCSPVVGGWTSWSSCVDGTQTRTCTNPAPSCGGANCSGPSSQLCQYWYGTSGTGNFNESCDNWLSRTGQLKSAVGMYIYELSKTDTGYCAYLDNENPQACLELQENTVSPSMQPTSSCFNTGYQQHYYTKTYGF